MSMIGSSAAARGRASGAAAQETTKWRLVIFVMGLVDQFNRDVGLVLPAPCDPPPHNDIRAADRTTPPRTIPASRGFPENSPAVNPPTDHADVYHFRRRGITLAGSAHGSRARHA